MGVRNCARLLGRSSRSRSGKADDEQHFLSETLGERPGGPFPLKFRPDWVVKSVVWTVRDLRRIALIRHLTPLQTMNHKMLERTLNTALEHHRAGDLAEAAKLYAQARRGAPNVYDCWYLSGTLALHRDAPNEAIPFLLRALQLARGGQESSQCRLFLGVAYADADRPTEAVPLLRAALAKHPHYDEAWEALTQALLALDRPTEATECLERLVALKPDRIDLRERLTDLKSSMLAVG